MWRADSETWTARDISSAPMSMLTTIAALPRPRMKGATMTHAPPAISTAACVVWGITRLPIVDRGYEHTCALCVTGITLIRTRHGVRVPSARDPAEDRHPARRARAFALAHGGGRVGS